MNSIFLPVDYIGPPTRSAGRFFGIDGIFSKNTREVTQVTYESGQKP